MSENKTIPSIMGGDPLGIREAMEDLFVQKQ